MSSLTEKVVGSQRNKKCWIIEPHHLRWRRDMVDGVGGDEVSCLVTEFEHEPVKTPSIFGVDVNRSVAVVPNGYVHHHLVVQRVARAVNGQRDLCLANCYFSLGSIARGYFAGRGRILSFRPGLEDGRNQREQEQDFAHELGRLLALISC